MRIDRDEYFLRIAEVVSERGTCARRQVGCVLTDKRGHILGTGYNGVEAGAKHCRDEWPCEGANMPSGEGLDLCNAIHGEANALLQCWDVHQIDTCYATHSPCIHCVKLLMGTSCTRIVFRHRYAHDEVSRAKWLSRAGRVWIHVKGDR